MTVPRVEKAYEKHAWIILFALNVIGVLFGLGDIILGAASDPAITEGVAGMSLAELQASNPRVANLVNVQTKLTGSFFLGFSLLGIAISMTGYRRGERWAWYALWSLPLMYGLIPAIFLSAGLVPGRSLPPPVLSGPIFLVIALLALLLPYRKFFPRK